MTTTTTTQTDDAKVGYSITSANRIKNAIAASAGSLWYHYVVICGYLGGCLHHNGERQGKPIS